MSLSSSSPSSSSSSCDDDDDDGKESTIFPRMKTSPFILLDHSVTHSVNQSIIHPSLSCSQQPPPLCLVLLPAPSIQHLPSRPRFNHQPISPFGRHRMLLTMPPTANAPKQLTAVMGEEMRKVLLHDLPPCQGNGEQLTHRCVMCALPLRVLARGEERRRTKDDGLNWENPSYQLLRCTRNRRAAAMP